MTVPPSSYFFPPNGSAEPPYVTAEGQTWDPLAEIYTVLDAATDRIQSLEARVDDIEIVNHIDVFKEIPTGLINDNNTIFTLAHTPTTDSEHVYLNGILQKSGDDYTLGAATITFASAPETDSNLVVTYKYS